MSDPEPIGAKTRAIGSRDVEGVGDWDIVIRCEGVLVDVSLEVAEVEGEVVCDAVKL